MSDDRLYLITYDDGSTKVGNRRMVGNAVGHSKGRMNRAWMKQIVSIGRAELPTFEDVTSEFLGENWGQPWRK
jgi:hypothetical protein